jgi:hypothetical protein
LATTKGGYGSSPARPEYGVRRLKLLQPRHLTHENEPRDLRVRLSVAKADPTNVEYETRAKNLLKGELKRRGVTYAQLAEKLAAIGVQENEWNLNHKISRGGFTAAFLIQCLVAV